MLQKKKLNFITPLAGSGLEFLFASSQFRLFFFFFLSCVCASAR